MLSAAITAELAKGRAVLDAVKEAKRFVTAGIEHALALGKGIGPVNPAWRNIKSDR
jgi:hydroxymethylpyrimidine/phosphomethylpyrimidine kinase